MLLLHDTNVGGASVFVLFSSLKLRAVVILSEQCLKLHSNKKAILEAVYAQPFCLTRERKFTTQILYKIYAASC